MRILAVLCALACGPLSGCGRPGIRPASTPPIVLKAPAEFSLQQRATLPLPGSGGKVVITIGDITRGQVLMTLSWASGPPILGARSLRQGDSTSFELSGHLYRIKLVKLDCHLVGQDHASFRLWHTTPMMETALRDAWEAEEIERLIQSLLILKELGFKFVRNEEQHTAEAAMDHLRRKCASNREKISTPEDFIRLVGSASSTSGEAYRIRMPDGTEMETEEWFREQLANDRAAFESGR